MNILKIKGENKKPCSQCGVVYPLTVENFYLRPRSKDGFESYCRNCARIMAKTYRTANGETIAAKKRKHYRENKDKYLKKVKTYAKSEQGIIARSKYRKRNRKRITEVTRTYELKQFNENIQFKLSKRLRSRMRQVLKSNQKSENTAILTGCSTEVLKEYLEKQFKPGMTWENHGEWHIDHKIPCAAFDLSDPCEQKRCFNFKNLQPLWAIDNLRKNDRISA